ncbi:hypothetical protein, partial [Pseudomonas rossensis]|uniref:hypothetical protein n=1 Tax=Pseudomonas rossensis TaxID=2305471 RepID=UPI0032615614
GTADKFKLNQPVQGAVAFGKYWYETDIGGVQTSEPVVKSFALIQVSITVTDCLHLHRNKSKGRICQGRVISLGRCRYVSQRH